MRGFLYYVPEVNPGVKLAELAKHRLGHAFDVHDAPTFQVAGVVRGPDNGPGAVLAHMELDEACRVGVYPDQRWRKIPRSKAWLCFADPDHPPGSEDLVRRRIIPGHFVQLGDGHPWMAPIARAIVEDGGYANALPQAITCDDEGKWQLDGVMPRYAELWKIAERWWDAQIASEVEVGDNGEQGAPTLRVTFDFAGVNDAALEALAANYRIGLGEIRALGLFTGIAVREVLNALIDWPTLAELVKKNLAASPPPEVSPSSAGPEASPPATVPPSPTSGHSTRGGATASPSTSSSPS